MQVRTTKRLLAACAACWMMGCGASIETGAGDPARSSSSGTTIATLGGSNYVFHDIGNYYETGTWSEVKPVIPTYHEAPERIRQQLEAMYQHGQRAIALVLWMTLLPPGVDQHDHVVSIRQGRLSDQQQSNLRAIIGHLSRIGYRKLVFRFANQSRTDARSWSTWHPKLFEKSWAMLESTVRLIEGEVARTSMERLYDLELEAGGDTTGQIGRYTTDTLALFRTTFPGVPTYGFSIIAGGDRVRTAIAQFAASGWYPPAYALDVYDEIAHNLLRAHTTLRDAGEGNKPVIIQETYYDSPQAAAEIAAARSAGLGVSLIFQWPLGWKASAQERQLRHADQQFPEFFGAYLGNLRPNINAASAGCNGMCAVLQLDRLPEHPRVDVRPVGRDEIRYSYSGSELAVDGRRVTVALRAVDLALFRTEGLRFSAVDPDLRVWSEQPAKVVGTGNEPVLEAGHTTLLVSGFGLCLDVHGPDVGNNGGHVQVWDCHRGENQRWRLTNSQLVDAAGLCLDVEASAMHSNGGRVQVWQCNGSQQQQWSYDGRQLRNGGGLCLDVHAPDAAKNGARVQVWQCSGAANQQWMLQK